MNDKIDDTKSLLCTIFIWSPVFIGALIGLGLSFLLDLFGMGIGLSLFTTNTTGAIILSIGGFLGMLFGTIVAMFTSGFAAGFFAGHTCEKSQYGIVYGFLAWCLSLFLMIIFSLTISNFMNLKANFPILSQTTNEVISTTQNVTTSLNPMTSQKNTEPEKNVHTIGTISLAMFILFIVGALSSCFGGYTGLYFWNRWYKI